MSQNPEKFLQRRETANYYKETGVVSELKAIQRQRAVKTEDRKYKIKYEDQRQLYTIWISSIVFQKLQFVL